MFYYKNCWFSLCHRLCCMRFGGSEFSSSSECSEMCGRVGFPHRFPSEQRDVWKARFPSQVSLIFWEKRDVWKSRFPSQVSLRVARCVEGQVSLIGFPQSSEMCGRLGFPHRFPSEQRDVWKARFPSQVSLIL